MKVIFLNIEHAKLRKPLLDFIISNSQNTDIFCFQEAEIGFLEELTKLLPNFDFSILEKKNSETVHFKIAELINNRVSIKRKEKVLNGNSNIGISEAVEVITTIGATTLLNVHGIVQPGHKKDDENRLLQSREILSYLQNIKTPVIIGGDFNLLPETESIKMFKHAGYRNLIDDFEIKTTRNKYAWEKSTESVKNGVPYFGKQLFADYVFVSPEVKVKSFEVPDIEISDHLPLILDFEV